MRIVIVEDETHSREVLKGLLEEFCEDIEIVGLASDVQSAIKTIRAAQPDLVFLDVELQTGTGFEVLDQVKDLPFDLVFTTAFEQYAVKAIKLSSIDYLLKPINIEELQTAVEKARVKQDQDNLKNRWETLLTHLKDGPGRKRICLATSEGMEFVNIADIAYCEANGAYTTFIMTDNIKLMVSKNLKEYEMLLVEQNFMRVHNSFLINLLEVKKYVKSDGGYILMKNDKQIPISPKKKDEFMDRMNHVA